MGLLKVRYVSDLWSRLTDLRAVVQGFAEPPNANKQDSALVEEAQRACDVGIELLFESKIVQARYACVYAETCIAVIRGDERSTDELRRRLEDLLKSETQI